MKASELRIGNYVDVINRHHKVHLPYGYVRAVGSIQFFKVELYHSDKPFATQVRPESTDIADLSPIPLTEEWLLKFGFEDKREAFGEEETYGGREYWDAKEGIIVKDGMFYFLRDVGSSLMYGDTVYAYKEIQYVHQLQNLYFALTGEELTITESWNSH